MKVKLAAEPGGAAVDVLLPLNMALCVSACAVQPAAMGNPGQAKAPL